MSIIQISKIQQRFGNIIDLPQLDESELGWATDARRLFIGKTTPNENIEVLTSYSNISFSQLDGSSGNLDITAGTLADGQVLVYDGTNWVNRGGAAGGFVDLGTVSDVTIGGGAIGYVLETDGIGTLSWTPKGTLIANISAISKANPAVVTTAADNFFSDGLLVTITNVSGMTQVNGHSYYANVQTSNTFALYSDSALTTPVDSSGFTTYSGNGRAISTLGLSGGGTVAGGANTSVQFNNNNILDGDADLTWDLNTNVLTVNGNADVGNINASSLVAGETLRSNVVTGTAPLLVTSTSRVANLSVDYANVSDFGVVTLKTTGTFYPTFVTGTATGNYALGANANISFNAATGNLSVTLLNVTGNANVGNIGASGNITGGNLITTGNITGNLIGIFANGTSNISIPAAGGKVQISVGAVPNVLVVTSTSANIDGIANVTGNIYGGNIIASGNIKGIFANGTSNVSIPVAAGNVNTSVGAIPNVFVVTTTGANVVGTITATGNVTGSNVIATTNILHSVASGLTALGTDQGTALAITKDIDVVTAGASGTGVILPTAIAGMEIIIMNLGANSLLVYPATGGTINSLALNGGYTLVTGGKLAFVATSATQWYSLNATYA